MTDMELLREHASNGSEEAFRLVVERHLGLVRGTALRQLGNSHHADEVCHAVFLALARKAASLREGTVIAGWLFRATRFAAAKLARDEERRTRRQKEAAMMHVESISDRSQDGVWNDIAPHLDSALESLAVKDRHAVLMRFFEGRSFAEVCDGLGTSEDAAKMRVGRALEKLRGYFGKRGCVMGAAALLSTLTAKAAVPVTDSLIMSVASGALKSGSSAVAVSSLAEAILRKLRLDRLTVSLKVSGALFVSVAIIGLLGARLGWFNKPNTRAPAWPPANRQQWPQR